jgi:A/G-specific adenine glycosylase
MSPAALTDVRDTLLEWYRRERRDFPWRETRHPYAVLVSEVMLQQTQASRVAERFPRFLARFPTVEALATAPTAAVLAEWNGLGYNRRAVALQRAAAHVSAHGWPRDVAGLAALPGIGPYTARAVASLAFGEAVGPVDTNVRRWLIRRFAVADRAVELQALADALAAPGPVDPDEAAAWTHASMEFGAAVCRSRAPRCEACPVAAGCPSRSAPAAVPVPRQPAYAGSDRALRGSLLRELARAPGHALAVAEARLRIGPAHPDGRFDAALASLERDGLVWREGDRLRLGSPQAALATIGS